MPAAQAQSAGTGALVGTVTDPSSAVVPNVTVTLTNTDTQQSRTATTSADGTYRFGFLPPGTYQVRFSANGFKPTEVPSVKVNVTETPVLDEKMEVGSQNEQVTVQANAEAIQTASSALGTVVSGNTATALPLNTRNYTNLLGLSAGANASVNNATALGRGGTEIAVNGALTSQNSFQMDGINITPYGNGGGVTQQGYAAFAVPNPDTIAEFKIQTSLYDAGYGRNVGANVNVVTKSGTNSFHGSAFEFFRNAKLNANDFFYNRDTCPTTYAGTTCPKQILNQNQYGGVIGGPIKKDKLFFFTSYQQTWQKNGAAASSYSSVLLPGLPAGDRGTRAGGPAGTLDATGAAYQQALGAAFCHSPNGPFTGGPGAMTVACNGSNINPIAMNFLQAKNTDGTYFIPSGSGRVAYSYPAYDREYQGMLNLDYVVNAKNTLAFRGYSSQEPQLLPLDGDFLGPNMLPGSPLSVQYAYKNAALKLTSILTNSLVNEARVSIFFTGQSGDNDPPPSTYASNIFPGVPKGQNQLGGGLPFSPSLTFPGAFLAGGLAYSDSFTNNTEPAIGDQVSWTKGKHTLRFGGEIERARWDWIFRGLSHGNLWFFSMNDFLLGLPGNCGPAVVGQCNGTQNSNIFSTQLFSTASSPSGIVHAYRAVDANLFVQDDFKVTPRLTLNLGLRWEYDGMVSDKFGNVVNMSTVAFSAVPVPGNSPATGTYAGWVVPSNYDTKSWGPLPPGVIRSNHLIPTHDGVPLKDFAPRLGFAWQPLKSSNRFVIRGGAGFFYDRVNGDDMIHAVEEAPPYAHDVNETGPANAFSSLANPWQPIPSGFPIRWVNFATGDSSNLSQIAIADHYLTPVVYSWNLNFQYEFLPRWVLEVGYVGSHGIHQGQNLHQTNVPLLATPSNPVNGITTSTAANASLRVPLLGFSPGGFQLADTVAAYKYNSLQVTLRKQLSHGVTFQGAYTFSRAFTNLTSNQGAGGSNSNDPNDLRQQYGLNPSYRPHRFVLNYSWDIPSGHLKGAGAQVLGGWNVSGLTTIQDGQPMSLYDSAGGGVYGLTGGVSRVQMAPGMTYASLVTPGGVENRLNNYFNQSALANIPYIGSDPGATVWGNSGVGIIFGPGQFNFDATISKTTRVGGIHENAALQFRAEFFNLFNHPQFNNPDNGRTDGSFGQISSTSVNARLIQLALKYIF
jgi:hypothetical protein